MLERLAVEARSILRRQDFVARYGGEEFFILLPGTPLADAVQLAEKLRAHIAATEFPGDDQVTISLGSAEYLADESLNDLVARADVALYEAKRSGRNRVVAAVSEALPATNLIESSLAA